MQSTSSKYNDSKQLQQFFYERLGDIDWNSYTLADHFQLKLQIGFALFGEPTEFNDKEGDTGYTEDQDEQINLIYKLIKQHHHVEDPDIIIMRIIFIVYNPYDKKKNIISVAQTPVFVIKKCSALGDMKPSNCCKIFIDNLGRVYMSWQRYLKNNKLPKCIMICPRNGKYTGTINRKVIIRDVDSDEGETLVDLETHESPACSLVRAALDVGDIVGTVTSVGATLPALAALIPAVTVAPAVLLGAAVTGGVVGVYHIGRSIANLVDRDQHKQTIGLQNAESRACWLGAAAGTVGLGTFAATGAITRLASNGRNISQSARLAFNALQVASLIGSGSNLINSGYNIINKMINKEEISALEIFQFSTSILFFYQSSVNFKTAKAIITETQADTLQKYGDQLRSNRHRKLFDKAQKESRRINGVMEGNAETIQGIKNINDPDNFFAGLGRINKDLNKSGARYTITANGEVQINSAHIIDPMEFSSNTRTERATILSSLPSPQPTITEEAFNIKKTEVYKTLKIFTEENQGVLIKETLDIALNIMSNESDMSILTLLLRKFSSYASDKILSSLVHVMKEVNPEIETKFRKLFPLFSFHVTVVQFIINFIEEICVASKISRDVCLKIMFDDMSKFVNDIVNKLVDWVEKKIKKMFVTEKPFINGYKMKKNCSVCQGYYFVTL